jgi:hypothetical protein
MLASRHIRTFTPRSAASRNASITAVGQHTSGHVDLLRSLADQGDIDPLQVLAGRVVDLRRRPDRTGRLGGARTALKRRAEQEGRKHEKPRWRDLGTAYPTARLHINSPSGFLDEP